MPIQPATKTKTIFRPRKLIRYENAYDLNNKLWDHYFQGNGQPVEIDLRGLSFSDSVDPEKLLQGIHPDTIAVITNLNNSPARVQQFFKRHGKDVSVVRETNNTVTTIHFKTAFSSVRAYIPKNSPRFWMFGNLTFDMTNTIVFVRHDNQTIEINSHVEPRKGQERRNEFDEFDFNPNSREFYVEPVVRTVNKLNLGNDYRIYALSNTHSVYKRLVTY
ncbi:MAG: hypothetical protein AB7P76_10970 [Candidatus Melainabacteria bacterium]